MKVAGVMICVLAGLLGLAAALRVVAPMPRAHLGRDVAILWSADGSVRRFREPGTYEVTVPCGQVRGREAPLGLKVEREPVEARDCTVEELLDLCKSRAPETVRFEDTLTSFEPLLGGGQDVLALPGGAEVGVGLAFRTAQGIMCLVPVDRPAAGELCGGGGIGMKWSLTGRPLLLSDGTPAFMVLGAAWPGGRDAGEPPWHVQVTWDGAPAADVTASGRHPLVLPCPFRPGARERATLQLREYQVVDLDVGGHPVKAELAATQAARSWGLQGRRSLGDDEGMIFYFAERLRPTFVMKTVSFPLSIAFITADGTIANIESMDPGYGGGVMAREPVNYVLEMRRGWFEAHGVEAGARVVIP
jgi:uncharacterized membrane protein (UPF0127 family)